MSVASFAKRNIDQPKLKVNTKSISDKTFDLVLFSTEDGNNSKTIRKLRLFRSMCDIYASKYNFRAILFTKTQFLVSALSNSSVIPVTDFE